MGAKGAALMLPFANTAAMQMHLDEISCNVAAKAHGVVLMDRAGWHSTDQLKVPKNLTIILLPSRSPELNPVENIWQYLRQNWLSNRVFEDYDAIIEAGCQAWNKLIDQPETIMSIGMRDWAIFRSIISAVGITSPIPPYRSNRTFTFHPAQCCAQLGNKTVPIRYLGKTGFLATKENPRHPIGIAGIIWLRGLDLNQRPSGYEFVK